MKIEKRSICLNVEDPEQKELFEFITKLPNGKRRNASAFLRTLVDREYQKKRDWYLEEKQRIENEKKTLKLAPIRTESGGYKIKI